MNPAAARSSSRARAIIGIMTSPQEGQILELNGISLYVEDHGDGVPVLLLHGWPDSARLWRHQVPFLVASAAAT